MPLDFSFLDQTTYAPHSLACPPSDSDVVATCSTVSHLLGLDLLSLSTSHNDAFYVALVVLLVSINFQSASIQVIHLRGLSSNLLYFPCFGSCSKVRHGDFLQIGCLKMIENRV